MVYDVACMWEMFWQLQTHLIDKAYVTTVAIVSDLTAQVPAAGTLHGYESTTRVDNLAWLDLTFLRYALVAEGSVEDQGNEWITSVMG